MWHAPFRLCATLLIGAVLLLLPAASGAAEHPVSVRHARSDWQVQSDGRAVLRDEREIVANNDAGARAIAQQVFTYSDGIDHVELVEAHTVKADGRRLPVRLDTVREQLAPGVPNMPMYADRKQRVLVFPDVMAGDAVAYTWRRVVDHPLFPGSFSYASTFGRGVEWRDAELSVTLPPGMELTTEAHGVEAVPPETAADGRRTWRWRHQADAVDDDASAVLPIDRAPRLFVSTFPDWPAFARTWAPVVAQAATVTPEIQALADEVTANTTDRREQARLLYEWVSLRVRWVAIIMGYAGGWIPHQASDILAARYGDCKDQVTLLTALLHAKGIPAEMVLISTGNTYALAAPPTTYVFDHVITYLPEWGIYADTTSGGAPFGTLPIFEYGKRVVHVGPEGKVRRVPALPPGLAVSKLSTDARLDADGRITGTTRVEAAGPYATMLRGAGRATQMQGPTAYAAQRLRASGQDGAGRVSPGDLRHVGTDYRIEARFRLEPQPGLAEGDPFVPPPGPMMLPPVGEGLLAPVDSHLPAARPTPCYAGVQEEELSLALPPGLRPVRLPRPRRIDEAEFSYESRWSQEGDTVRVHRRLESRLTVTLCTGVQREAAARALTVIRRDRQARLLLEETDVAKAE